MTTPTKILIKNAAWLVTLDATRRIIRDGYLMIEDGRISDIGRTSELRGEADAGAVTIDGADKLVIPGLIDGHVHSVQQLAKGLADEVDLQTWMYDRIFPYEAEMTDEDAYISALLCQLELIKAGTTTFFDPGSYHPDQVVRAIGESGMRGVVARSALDLYTTTPKDVPQRLFREGRQEALDRGEDLVKRSHGAFGGRVRCSFSWRLLIDSSDELCLATADLAARYGVMIQTHGDASKQNAELSRRAFGKLGIERLRDLGILRPNVLFIHMGGIGPKGLLLMREADAKGVSCPVASAHLGGSTTPYLPEMIDLGLGICFGSDSAPNGNFLDVVRAMHFAALTTKRDRLDPRALPPESLLETATLGGAKASLWDAEIGSLEVGKRADVTLFDLDRPEWRPVHNPIANLVYCGSGASADTVIVDGKILMAGRVVRSIDERAVLKEGQERATAIARRAGLADKAMPSWPVL